MLLVDCSDRPGLIHDITGVLSRHGMNIITNNEFVDHETGRFFMRSEFVGGDRLAALRREVQGVLPSDAVVRFGGNRTIVFD